MNFCIDTREFSFKPFNLDQFKILLRKANIQRPDQSVMNKVVKYFFNRVMIIETPTQALELYYDAKNYPGTITKAFIKERLGIRINGPIFPESSVVYAGCNEDGCPVAIKILSQGMRSDSEIKAIKTLDLENVAEDIGIVKGKINTLDIADNDAGVFYRNGSWICFIMPHYPASLASMPGPLPLQVIFEQGTRIKSALDWIHCKNLVHMDIKPANILVSTDGLWYICDFGSCVKRGGKFVSFSEFYLPLNFNQKYKNAEPELDYYMLAVTLLIVAIDKPDPLTPIMHESFARVKPEKLEIEVARICHKNLKQFISQLFQTADLH